MLRSLSFFMTLATAISKSSCRCQQDTRRGPSMVNACHSNGTDTVDDH